jgi:hypothetical protein
MSLPVRSAQEQIALLDEMAWKLDDVELELACWHVTPSGAVLVPCTLQRM